MMHTRAWRWAALALAAWGLAGCAPVGPVAPGTGGAALFVDAAFAAPVQPIDPARVFALSSAMHDYLEREIAEQVRAHGLQRGLIDALYSKQQLALAYDAEFTRNAAEAFDARAGNCLSLAIMTGAFAKALGLAVRYRAVQVDDSWGRDGDLGLYVGHVNVSIGRQVPAVRTIDNSPDWWTIDFLPPADIKNQRTEPINEARIVAMYMNNRAAEALARRRTDDAYWWVRAAIQADPGFADAYNTLGVTYWRRGLPAPAEEALHAALRRRPEHPQAMGNLVVVLRQLGRPAEADGLEARLARLHKTTPFAAFQRGLQAYNAGDFAQARDQFARAVAGSNDFHEFHYWLAMSYLQLGDTERAARHLHEAEANSATRQQQSAYAAKLARLKAGAGDGPPPH